MIHIYKISYKKQSSPVPENPVRESFFHSVDSSAEGAHAHHASLERAAAELAAILQAPDRRTLPSQLYVFAQTKVVPQRRRSRKPLAVCVLYLAQDFHALERAGSRRTASLRTAACGSPEWSAAPAYHFLRTRRRNAAHMCPEPVKVCSCPICTSVCSCISMGSLSCAFFPV